jgi:tetratricopeptide (TPR) repeat protein
MSRLLAAFLILALGMSLSAPQAEATDAAYQNHMRNARLLLSRGDAPRALEVYERVLAEHPLDSPASVGKADALITMGRLDEAEIFLTDAIARIDQDADLYRIRVKLRRAQKDGDGAFSDVLRVVIADEERAVWALVEARDLLGDGLPPADARRLTLAARAENPTVLTFTLMAGVLAMLDGAPGDGLALVVETENAQGLKGSLLTRYAEELDRLGYETEALTALETAAARTDHPAHRSQVLFQVAEIQEQLKRYPDALATLARIVEERRGTATAGKALLASAAIHQKYLDEPEQALAVYLQIENDPVLGHRRPDLLLQMGDCYLRLGRFDEAADAYTRVLPDAIEPEQAETASFQLAETAFFRGLADSAMVLYQDMAETYPRSLRADDAAGRYILLNKYATVGAGVAVQVLGRMEWGRMAADSAVVDSTARILIDNYGQGELGAEAWTARAEIARRAGAAARALEYLEHVSTDFAADARLAPIALMEQGDILLQDLDRPQEALLRYESILTDYPNCLQAGDARRLVEALRRDLKS